MAHYAFLDSNNIVTHVIVGKDENEGGIDWEEFYANEVGQVCKRTSFNTVGGRHLNGGTPFRKNYAGIGYFYDVQRDAFIPPKSYPSWVLDETRGLWVAPVTRPVPIDDLSVMWNEETLSWDPV
jgi:hypothetical protein